MIMLEEGSTAGNAAELCSLAEAVCNGTIATAQYERLNSLLSADEDAARFYATYLRMHGLLLWHWQDADVSPVSRPALPIVVETSPFPSIQTSLFANLVSPGGYLFSYSLAVFIVGIGLLIGWACQMPLNQEVAVNGQRPSASLVPASERDAILVGRVTGMVDCQWADPKTGTVLHANVPLGRKYALASGLLKITYDTGARVILQGPCTYQVESRTGGYLSLGRLTVKAGGRGESERNPTNQTTRNDASPLSPTPHPLFSVRTPTAMVTDLGTEFGVEVDKSGVSRAHVYEGKVELRAVDGGHSKPILLRANESARANFGKDGVVAVVRQAGQKSALVREMPKPVSIVLFNTGVGLKEGESDPHWQIVARSDDAAFKPQAGLFRGPGGNALENDPARSQWLSLVGGDAKLPEEVVYVFRTTFDLRGMLPSTAALQGRFIADDRVVAVRLNGRRLPVPVQRDGDPFIYWAKFHVAAGFVTGTNVLEFDVLNACPFTSPSERRTAKSRMMFRVEMEGEACPDPGLGRDDVSDEASPAPALERDKNAAMKSKGQEQEKTGQGRNRTPSAGTRSVRYPSPVCSGSWAWARSVVGHSAAGGSGRNARRLSIDDIKNAESQLPCSSSLFSFYIARITT